MSWEYLGQHSCKAKNGFVQSDSDCAMDLFLQLFSRSVDHCGVVVAEVYDAKG
jgi:hypothetical protein